MSWLNSDSYDTGFEQGRSDAMAGKKRNVLSFKAGMKSVMALNSRVFQDTYIEGYKEGFRIGQTIKAVKGEEFIKDQSINSEQKNINQKNQEKESERAGINRKKTDLEKGIKIKSTIHNTKSQLSKELKFSYMSTTQIYQIQEQQLTELAHFLGQFKEEINERMQNYQAQVDNMYSNGLPQETYEKFQREHINETNALVQRIVSLIDSQSIPFIQGNIQRMQELISYNQ
jgi:hypothetical protein